MTTYTPAPKITELLSFTRSVVKAFTALGHAERAADAHIAAGYDAGHFRGYLNYQAHLDATIDDIRDAIDQLEMQCLSAYGPEITERMHTVALSFVRL